MLISSVWRAGSGWIFTLGLVLGGVVVAVLAVVLGALAVQWWLPDSVAVSVVAVVMALALARDFGLLRFRLPQNARQVPEAVTRTGPWWGALQFGFEMGTGMRTFMTSALPHAMFIAVILLAGSTQGLIAGVGFGLGRALVPLSRAIEGEGWTERFDRNGAIVRTAMAATMAVCLAGLV